MLPFAGLEVAVLAVALVVCHRRSRQRELIRIEPTRVLVDRLAGSQTQHHEFPRQWFRIDLRKSPLRNHPSRLLVGSYRRVIEIGRCLTEDERLGLWRRLRKILNNEIRE